MGEADNYYNASQRGGYQQQQQYQQEYQQPYQQQQYQQQYQQQQYQQNQYEPPAPTYHSGPNQGYDGPPPPINGGGGYGYASEGGEKPSFEQTFEVKKPKWNDLWAGLLLIAVLLGFAALSGITIYGYTRNSNTNSGGVFDDGNRLTLGKGTIVLFALCLAVSLVFSYAYVWLARLFPKQFIWVTGILNICFALGTAVWYLYRRYWSAGIVFLIFGLFMAFCFWTWRKRIPFSALMLKTTIDVSKNYGHVYLVSFLGGLVAVAFAAWYSVTLVAIYDTYQPGGSRCPAGSCSNAKVIGLIAFATFAMYWISEWLKNTIHTMIAGVYGSWYFCPNNFPRGATRGSAKRALTYSFGSISLGSLIVAIIQFLRTLCSIGRSEAAAQGGVLGAAGSILFCVLGCFVGILEWAVRFFNKYAYCHIALYGKAYVPAAKDTWKMIKDRGIDALINDCLIDPVLSFGGLFIGYACALLGYLYLYFTDPAYNQGGAYTPVIVAFSFLIGFQIANVFTTPLGSGVDTIFVAMGWDPQVLSAEHPELYEEMVRVYPRVQQVISSR